MEDQNKKVYDSVWNLTNTIINHTESISEFDPDHR